VFVKRNEKMKIHILTHETKSMDVRAFLDKKQPDEIIFKLFTLAFPIGIEMAERNVSPN
jgi:hypothetical protein